MPSPDRPSFHPVSCLAIAMMGLAVAYPDPPTPDDSLRLDYPLATASRVPSITSTWTTSDAILCWSDIDRR